MSRGNRRTEDPLVSFAPTTLSTALSRAARHPSLSRSGGRSHLTGQEDISTMSDTCTYPAGVSPSRSSGRSRAPLSPSLPSWRGPRARVPRNPTATERSFPRPAVGRERRCWRAVLRPLGPGRRLRELERRLAAARAGRVLPHAAPESGNDGQFAGHQPVLPGRAGGASGGACFGLRLRRTPQPGVVAHAARHLPVLRDAFAFVSAGLDIGVLEERTTRIEQTRRSNGLTYTVPAASASRDAVLLRPVVAAGVKSYFNDRVFVRPEGSLAFRRPGMAQVNLRLDIGVDF